MHFLDRDGDLFIEKYPAIEEALWETHRFLKTKGVLLVDTEFQEVHEMNPISLVSKAFEIWKKRYINENELIDLIENSNFCNRHYLGPPNYTFFTNDHVFHKIDVLTDPDMNTTLSCFGIMENTGKLEEVKQLIKEKITDSTLDELKEKYSKKLRIYGLYTNVFAQKKVTSVS